MCIRDSSNIIVLDDDISDGDLKIKAKGKGFLNIYSLHKNQEYRVYVDDNYLLLKSDDNGCLKIKLNNYWSEIKIVRPIKVTDRNLHIYIVVLLAVSIIGIYKLILKMKSES